LRLTGEAALRAGAGKLQLGTIAEAALLLGMFVPEASVFGLSADAAGELDVSAADEVVEHARSCDAIVLGPGMRSFDSCAELVGQIASALPPDIALLLDAAAIAACRRCRDVIKGHAGPVVLTPHHGEMATLLDTDINDIERMPEAAACKAASELDAVVVLKAAETIIATPGETSLCFAGGSPGLATGGSGGCPCWNPRWPSGTRHRAPHSGGAGCLGPWRMRPPPDGQLSRTRTSGPRTS
jgi:NAD(P)H-hydrate repair Nnr-like enzyme with NAD(P)H-hydrate dehydratase domain